MTQRMRAYKAAVRLALASVLHNWQLSICTTIIYAAIVSPAIIVFLLKTGVISAWANDLSRDVQSREIDIKGEYHNKLIPAEMARLGQLPGVDFVVGEAMALVSTRQMRRVAPNRGPIREIKVRTSEKGDPLLPVGFSMSRTDVILSARAAERLQVDVGDTLAFTLRRQPISGEAETHRLPFTVSHVVDARRWPGEAVFLLPDVAVSMGRWISSSLQDVNSIQSASSGASTNFASFRIYAESVHAATGLLNQLVEDGYDATLRVADVSRMKLLEQGLNLVFGVLLSMSAIGLFASIFLLQWLSVERQKPDLALLLAAGHDRARLRAFIIGQALILSFLGLLIAVMIAGISFSKLAPIVLQQVDLPVDVLHWPTPASSIFIFICVFCLFATLTWLAVGRLRTAPLVAALRSD